jgi:hypothetical protein
MCEQLMWILLHILQRLMPKRDDTSTGTAVRATQCDSLLEGLTLSYAQTRWTQGFLCGLGHQSVKPYIKLELNLL